MYRKNTAGQFVCFQLLLTATGAVATGLSPAVRRCIDGTFAAGGGTVTEDGATGSYKYAMAQADTNGNDISFIFTATGAMPVCVNIVTTAADPTDTVRFGLTALPNVASGSAGAIPTTGTGANQISVSSGQVIVQSGTGTGQLSFTSGILKVDVDTIKTNPVVNAGTITFPTTATLASTTNITAGTITTVTNLTNAPTAGDLTATMKTSVTTAASAATPTIAGTQTFNNTGTWTGNITGSVNSVTSRVTSNTDQLNGDATAAANIAKTTRAIGRGTVTTGSSTTSVLTSAFTPNGAAANQFVGRIITFDATTATAALQGQSTDITASSNAANPTFTVTALTTAPANGDTFSVT